ncbi:MAG: ABC transporter ATP-binding protein [Promicromonosporaceae bacterium]|nr:ABC transporter ATP-binding protein [Promicromonosporaceae bacterium]
MRSEEPRPLTEPSVRLAEPPIRVVEPFVRFDNVVREYHTGETVVRANDGVTFDLAPAELSLIVGPSGAGKTTVLNILGGMDAATSGSVSVAGRDISQLSRRQLASYRRNDIGFVFQFYNLIPNLTALENVELASQISPDALDPTAVLAEVGLEHRLNNFPAQLSGGEQQRVAIARAIAKNPKLLLCDEPTGALDYETGRSILDLLQQTCRNRSVTVVIITHNLAITPMANRMIAIKNGKVETITDNRAPQDVLDLSW